MALGGQVSTNYAALACTDFPTCHGTLAPPADYAHGAGGAFLPISLLMLNFHPSHRHASQP